MIPFDISISFDFIEEWAQLPLYLMFWEIYKNGGWFLFLIVFLKGTSIYWLNKIQAQYAAKQKHILLAIDVPKDNEQTVKAVENIFVQLHGAHGTKSWWERWVEGQFQLYFSFELVSIDGYIQYIIWSAARYKDLIESSVYAQYPDAEITEIADYTENVPLRYPDPEWNCWGTEYEMKMPDYYPIKTWREFEDPSAEFIFKDPMAGMMEALGNMRVGEQLWLQILIIPIIDSWRKGGEKLVKQLIGAEIKEDKPGVLETVFKMPGELFAEIAGIFIPSLAPKIAEPSKKQDGATLMQHLSTGEKDVVEAIQHKLSMMDYKCKFRSLYVAKKELYTKNRGAGPVIGAVKQFNTNNLNALKPDKKTWCNANYFWKDARINARRNTLIRAFRNRSSDTGHNTQRFSVEELATLWHFPMKDIKTPLLTKTEVKKGEPPRDLPLDVRASFEGPFVPSTGPAESPVSGAPEGLPIAPEGLGEEALGGLAAESAVSPGPDSLRGTSPSRTGRKGAAPASLPVPEPGAADQDTGGPPSNLPVIE